MWPGYPDEFAPADVTDDEAIAQTVRERDANDTGERLTIAELAKAIGIDNCPGCGTDLDAEGACPCCEGART